tara:strand:+ start:497 stop:4789 length:4293 start_codon:yes stop_codon:yes gene_type:complete
MKGNLNKKQSKGLPGGPHEQFTYVTGVFMQDMYHVPKAQKGNKEFIKPFNWDSNYTTPNDYGTGMMNWNKKSKDILNDDVYVESDYENFDEVTEQQRQEAVNYINSPGYLKILSKNYDNPKAEQKARLKRVSSVPYEIKDKIGLKSGYINGLYLPDTHSIELENWGYKGIPLEEFNHSSVWGRMSDREKEGINKAIGGGDYDKDPQEVQNRLMMLKKAAKEAGLYDYNKEDFTKDHLLKLKESIKKNPKKYNYQQINSLIKNVKSDNDLIWLMNNVAYNDTGDLTIGQEGLETPDPMIKFNQLARNTELQPIYPYQPMKKGKVENEAQDFLTKMVNSSLFEERYNTMRGYKTPARKEEIDEVKNNMKYNIQNVDYWPIGFTPHNEKWTDSFNALAWYNPDLSYQDSKYGINKVSENFRNSEEGYIPHTIFRQDDDPTLALHELSHASLNYALPNKVDIPFSKNPAKQEAVKRFGSKYYRSGEEGKAHLDELRKYLYDNEIYDATTKSFNENDYTNLIKEYNRVKEELKKDPTNRKLKYILTTFEKQIEPYDKEQTIQSFNSFVDNSSSNEMPIGKYGGNVSTEGYKSNSPDVNNPFNIIPSGNITMKGVDFPVRGVDNLGNEKIMYPGEEHQFPGDMVYETPVVQKGYQVPGLEKRMQHDKYPSMIPKDMFAFMTPTEKDPLSKNIKGVFGMGAYNFNKTPFGVEAGIYKNLDHLPHKGKNNISITDANLTGTYNTGTGVKFKAGPNLTTIGFPDGRTIAQPATNLGVNLNFPKLNLGINSTLTTDFKDNYGVKSAFNYRTKNNNTSIFAEAKLNNDFFKGKGTPEFRAGLNHNMRGKKEKLPKELQQGGSNAFNFNDLVNKYTTQGWASLNPQEQQFYRETYQRGGSLPSYQKKGEKSKPNLKNLWNEFKQGIYKPAAAKLQQAYKDGILAKDKQGVYDPKDPKPSYTWDNSYSDRGPLIKTKQQAQLYDRYHNTAPNKEVGSIQRPTPISWKDELLRQASAPMTSIGRALRGETGTAWEKGDNLFDYAFDAVNPYAWAQYGVDANELAKQGDWGSLSAATEAIPFFPLFSKIGKMNKAKKIPKNLLDPENADELAFIKKELEEMGSYDVEKDLTEIWNAGANNDLQSITDIYTKNNQRWINTLKKEEKDYVNLVQNDSETQKLITQKSNKEKSLGAKYTKKQRDADINKIYERKKELLIEEGYDPNITIEDAKRIEDKKMSSYHDLGETQDDVVWGIQKNKYVADQTGLPWNTDKNFISTGDEALGKAKDKFKNYFRDKNLSEQKKLAEGVGDYNYQSKVYDAIIDDVRDEFPDLDIKKQLEKASERYKKNSRSQIDAQNNWFDSKPNYSSVDEEVLDYITNFKQQGGSIDNKQFEIYQNYINGVFDEVSEQEAEKVYDKLNRMYYAEAKEKGMAPANYIMTHIIGSN